jgi:hypothetical protein
LRRFEEEELTNYSHLQSILNDNNMLTEVDWGSNLKERYPRTLVTVTPAMRKNYKKFGDFLCFDITENAIRNLTMDGKKYKLCVFCVIDTNLRVLLAGLALSCERESENIEKIFDMFFKLQEESPHPFTVMTSPQKEVVDAITSLQSAKIYRGIHILDPHHII